MDWQEARPIVLATIRWCRVLADQGRGWPTEDDADHSALLRRLLAGKDPLPQPPPIANRYPWYALVDNGTDTTIDLWDAGDGHLFINQARWQVIEQTPDWWRVRWQDQGPVYRVEPFTLYEPGSLSSVGKPAWRLTREVGGQITA